MTVRRGLMCALALSAVFQPIETRQLEPAKTQGNKSGKPADTKQYLRHEPMSEKDPGRDNADKGRAVGLQDVDKGPSRPDKNAGGKLPDVSVPGVDPGAHEVPLNTDTDLTTPLSTDTTAHGDDAGHTFPIAEEPLKNDTDLSAPIPTILANDLTDVPSKDAVPDEIHLDVDANAASGSTLKTQGSKADQSEPITLSGDSAVKSTVIDHASSTSSDAKVDEPIVSHSTDDDNLPVTRKEPMTTGSNSGVRWSATGSDEGEKAVHDAPVKSDVESPSENSSKGSDAKEPIMVHDNMVGSDVDSEKADSPSNEQRTSSEQGPASGSQIDGNTTIRASSIVDNITQNDLVVDKPVDVSSSEGSSATSQPVEDNDVAKNDDIDDLVVYDDVDTTPLVLIPPKVFTPPTLDTSSGASSSSSNDDSNVAISIIKDVSTMSNLASSNLDDVTSPIESSSSSSGVVSKPFISQNGQTISNSDNSTLIDGVLVDQSSSHGDWDVAPSSGSLVTAPIPLRIASESKQFASTDKATNTKASFAVAAVAGIVGVAGIILTVFGYRHRSQDRMRRSTLSHSAVGNDAETEEQTGSITIERAETDAEGTDIEGTFTNDISTVTV